MPQLSHAGGRQSNSPTDVMHVRAVSCEYRPQILEKKHVFQRLPLTLDRRFTLLRLLQLQVLNFFGRTGALKVLLCLFCFGLEEAVALVNLNAEFVLAWHITILASRSRPVVLVKFVRH